MRCCVPQVPPKASLIPSQGVTGRSLRRGLAALVADQVDVETAAVPRKRWLAGTVTDQRFAAAMEDLVSWIKDPGHQGLRPPVRHQGAAGWLSRQEAPGLGGRKLGGE